MKCWICDSEVEKHLECKFIKWCEFCLGKHFEYVEKSIPTCLESNEIDKTCQDKAKQ